MKLSIVATLYQSSAYIDEFCRRVGAAARQLVGEDYEIVLVNDGSPDNSLDVAVQLTLNDSHVVVVDLSRNFGHHKAMMTGLSAASGERVFLIDSDLEEEPEWLTSFAAQMEADASDVVYGVQAERRGGIVEQVSGTLFYKLFRTLTGIVQPSNIVTARLMTRRYVDGLLMHEERELNIGGLWVITGFRQSQQVVRKHATSPTTYSLSRKFSHLVNAITSFSGGAQLLEAERGAKGQVSGGQGARICVGELHQFARNGAQRGPHRRELLPLRGQHDPTFRHDRQERDAVERQSHRPSFGDRRSLSTADRCP
jgi:putative glycosyltransferase